MHVLGKEKHAPIYSPILLEIKMVMAVENDVAKLFQTKHKTTLSESSSLSNHALCDKMVLTLENSSSNFRYI